METPIVEILIVGAGVAGLSTALGLHRLGIRSLVLESSESLRATGFALTMWTNSWKALDELGIADSLRPKHDRILELVYASTTSALPITKITLTGQGKHEEHETRRVERKDLLEAMEKELPVDTIRYSSKVVSIEESGWLNVVHLADGSILRTKVLIGCDGVNSVVAKWLGFKKPVPDGRMEIKGRCTIKRGHQLGLKFWHLFGTGISYGIIPGDHQSVYWFFTFYPSYQGTYFPIPPTLLSNLQISEGIPTWGKKELNPQSYNIDEELQENPEKMKQFVLRNLGSVPEQIVSVIENSEVHGIACYPLSFRAPWEILFGNISKDNVCVAGDALHPMTPDIGQGAGSAMEDGIVLARCLVEAMHKRPRDAYSETGSTRKEFGYEDIKSGLSKYAEERRWRAFELISTSYLIGLIKNSGGKVMIYVRDKLLAPYIARLSLKKADFDCGKLKTV